MLKLKSSFLSLLVVAITAAPVMAGNNDAKTANENVANTSSAEASPTAASPDPSPSVGLGLAPTASDANVTALLGVLVMKGVLAPTEANAIRDASPTAQFQALVQTLSQKGLVSASDLSAITAVPGTMAVVNQAAQAPAAPAGPSVIPAVAPLRVLPIDLPKQGGIIPDVKLGSGANLKFYGFYKATAVSDTASSGGPTFGSQDWPLPLLIGGDTGPTSDPQVHIKARGFRIGAQAEWVPKGSDFTVTGRVEGDFEGDYTDVNNRNISGSVRSQFSLRLAWMRLDHKIGNLPWFAEFGEDWSLLSSTLPALLETTGNGIAMGSLYERIPMFRTGVQFHSGDFKVQPEFAIVLPAQGSSALTVDQRLRFGDRAGAESNQPGLEARVVFQFPLNKNWKGVAPAQIIFSGHHARMNEIIPHAAQILPSSFTFTPICTNNLDGTITCDPVTVPAPKINVAGGIFTNVNSQNVGFTTANKILNAPNCTEGSSCNLEQMSFTGDGRARGAQVGNPQNIWTAEVQLPTPWVTFAAKYYRGNDMRFFFTGQLNDVFSNTSPFAATGLEVGSGISESGRAILFGCSGGTKSPGGVPLPPDTIDCQGTPVVSAIMQPVGGSGGFAELSFPLSRIFHANPEGPNSGWVLHVSYSTDRAKYSDVAAFGTVNRGNRLGRTDLDTASLTYRLNKWVTFVHEASYITTFTANKRNAEGVISGPQFLLFAGKDVRQAHNWRNEFGPVFTF